MDFSKLTFPIHGVNADWCRKFPILKDYGFDKLPDSIRNETIKYIIYAFDRNSPLHSIPDVLQRRKKAVELAGFKLNSRGNYSKEVEDIIFSQNELVNHLIIQFCVGVMKSSEDWMSYMVYQEAFRKQNEKLLNGDTDNEKTKDIIVNIDNLGEKIREVRKRLLSDNEDKFLTRSLYDFSEIEKLCLSPEDYAMRFKAKE